MDHIIELEHLTKRYGRSRGVEDLNLAMAPGQVFGFLGPNGAGKTTTLRLLLDFIRPTSGHARLFGLDAQRDSVAIRRRVGFLPGELSLYGNLTGAQTLRYLGNLRGGVDEAYVRQLAERLDLDLSRKVKAYSHGNKQKLGLVQALMPKPELVILDEPSQGLDPLVQQEFYKLVLEIKGEGRTVFLCSHILPEVDRTCDQVGIIREGRLVTVEAVGALKHRAIRQVEIDFAEPVPAAAFANLPNVSHVRGLGRTIAAQVQGHADALIKAASQYPIVDLRSQEPTLEDIFLAYYGAGNSASHGAKEPSHAA